MTIDQILNQLNEDNLTAFALPLFLLAIGIELILSHKRQLHLYRLKDSLISLSMLILSAVTELLPKILAFIAFSALHEISPLRDVIGRQWWAWVMLFFLDDLTYYWFHRANHEVRLL